MQAVYITFSRVLLAEWRWMIQAGLLTVLIPVFLLISAFGIHYGRTVVKDRMNAQDSLQQHYQHNRAQLIQLVQSDTTTAQGKTDYIMGSHPAVADYRLQAHSWHPPGSFAVMATGLSDLARNAYPVTLSTNYTPQEEKLNNPLKLLTGNFDMAFVFVYLLPLLVIVFNYNLLSQEKELGTMSLLMLQSGNPATLLLLRLFIRFLVLAAVVALLTWAGLLWSPVRQSPQPGQVIAWLGVLWAYLAFWTALTWFILSWNGSSAMNAMCMTGTWLLLLIMLPSFFALAFSDARLDNDGAVLAAEQREIEWDTWELSQKQLLDSFYTAHPQYRDAHAYDTLTNDGRRAVAYYELVAQRVKRLLSEETTARSAALSAVAVSYPANPAVYAQSLLNRIAGTDVTDYEYFRQQTTTFQEQWERFFWTFYFEKKPVDVAAYHRLPVYLPAANTATPAAVIKGIAWLCTLAAVLLLLGRWALGKRIAK